MLVSHDNKTAANFFAFDGEVLVIHTVGKIFHCSTGYRHTIRADVREFCYRGLGWLLKTTIIG